MKLRQKILVVLAGVVTLSVALNYGVLHSLVLPSFYELERDEAQRNLNRVQDAIGAATENISNMNADWKNWGETYQYAEDKNPSYIERNLGDIYTTLSGINVNTVYIYDGIGNIVYHALFDLESGESLPTDDFLLNRLPIDHSLFQHPNLDKQHTGILSTEFGPMLFAAGPILDNEKNGPSRGTMLLGRFLDEALLEQLVEQTHVAFTLQPPSGATLPEDVRSMFEQSGVPPEGTVIETAEQTVFAYAVLRDFSAAPVALIRADTPRNISAVGFETMHIALLGVVIAGIVAMTVMGFLLRGVVVGPLLGLAQQIARIGVSNDVSARVDARRSDEIGALGKAFDRMLERLENSQKRLMEQSFDSGVEQMAGGMLHNVRNQLSPLTLRIGQLRRALVELPEKNIAQAVSELTDQNVHDDRRAKLAQYINLTAANAAENQRAVGAQIEVMTQALAKLDMMLAEQEQVGQTKRAVQPVKLHDLLSEAMAAVPAQIRTDIEIAVDPSTKALRPVVAERVLLKQVLINLLLNAADAVEGAGAKSGKIHVRASLDTLNGQEQAHISIKDNGVGIAPDQISTVFQRGFSTKSGDKRGLGLHWCANCIASMNGRIEVESEGSGRGATFHLLIPTAQPTAEAA